MTLHKAKGLEFDLVVLPELYSHYSLSSLASSGMITAYSGNDLTSSWVLSSSLGADAEADLTLREALRARNGGLRPEGCAP